MTETTFPPGPPAPPPPPGEAPPPGPTPPPASPPPGSGPWHAALTRPRQGRVVKGVAAGLGRATGTDPVLWRVLLVVLIFFGGLGLVLYLVGWVLMPEDGAEPSSARRLLAGGGATVTGVLVLGVLLLLAARRAGRRPPAGARRAAASGCWCSCCCGSGPSAPASPGPRRCCSPRRRSRERPAQRPRGARSPGRARRRPADPPAAPRRRAAGSACSPSARCVLVLGLLGLAASLGAHVTATGTLAAALLVTGAGLLLGAWWGRSRWLVALAVVLALLLAGASTTQDRYGTDVGDRTWVVQGSESHRLAAGEPVLDLRELSTDGSGTAAPVVVSARLGLGSLTVLVPQDLRVEVTSEVALGAVTVNDEPAGTTDRQEGSGLRRTDVLGAAGAPQVRLEIRAGVAEVEVRRVAAQ